jgi:hypothetical protein
MFTVTFLFQFGNRVFVVAFVLPKGLMIISIQITYRCSKLASLTAVRRISAAFMKAKAGLSRNYIHYDSRVYIFSHAPSISLRHHRNHSKLVSAVDRVRIRVM